MCGPRLFNCVVIVVKYVKKRVARLGATVGARGCVGKSVSGRGRRQRNTGETCAKGIVRSKFNGGRGAPLWDRGLYERHGWMRRKLADSSGLDPSEKNNK